MFEMVQKVMNVLKICIGSDVRKTMCQVGKQEEEVCLILVFKKNSICIISETYCF